MPSLKEMWEEGPWGGDEVVCIANDVSAFGEEGQREGEEERAMEPPRMRETTEKEITPVQCDIRRRIHI